MTTKDQGADLLRSIFSPCYQLGMGFDIFGTYSLLHGDSAKSQLINIDSMPTRSVDFMGKEVSVPTSMNLVTQTTIKSIEGTAETRDAFQRKFAANVQVEASYGSFSGQFSYAYSNESESSSAYKYAFKSLFNNYGRLSMDDLTETALKPDIRTRIQNLKTDEDYATFFSDFGTHYVSRIDLGANLEMYTSVENSSSMSTTEIDTSFSAHYKGLFFSAGASIETKDKEAWQKYSASSRTSIKGAGGDVSLLSRLTQADPFKPNGKAYDQWLESTKKAPVSTSFELKGIWLLVADQAKRKQMERAFHKYAQSFRLALTFENNAMLTRLTVDANTIPEPKRIPGNDGLQGWRLTVLDKQNPTRVIHDQLYPYNPTVWRVSAPAMYQSMNNDIVSKNLNNKSYIIVASTYGLMMGLAAPSNEVYEFLTNAGGGKELELFENIPRFSANPKGMIRYSMIGVPRTGKGAGIEVIGKDSNGNMPRDINAKAFLYKSALEGDYSIGREGRLSMDKDLAAGESTDEIGEASHTE